MSFSLIAVAEPPRLLDRLVAVRRDDAVLAQDDLGVDARLVDAAEHLRHPAERRTRGRRPPRDLDRHHVARRGAVALAVRDLDVHDQPAIERHDEAHAALVHVVAPDGIAGAALEDPDDPPLGAAVGDPLDARDDAVAVHGLVEIAAGDVDVAGDLLVRAVRHDEAEAAGVRRDLADHEVHPVGHAVAVAARLDERAAGHELAEQALEGGALLARQLQPLQQFAGGGGMLDLLPNELQELFLVQHTGCLVRNLFTKPGGIFQPHCPWPGLQTV